VLVWLNNLQSYICTILTNTHSLSSVADGSNMAISSLIIYLNSEAFRVPFLVVPLLYSVCRFLHKAMTQIITAVTRIRVTPTAPPRIETVRMMGTSVDVGSACVRGFQLVTYIDIRFHFS